MSQFVCSEYAGCSEQFCGYPGEEDCHDVNVPVPGCECALCRERSQTS